MQHNSSILNWAKGILAALAAGLMVITAGAQTDDGRAPDFNTVPEELQGIEITQKLEAQLPLDLKFTNEDGERVALGDYFESELPVILTMNYYRCPRMCGIQLNNLLDTIQDMEWALGEKYRIVTVSFDHNEGADLARIKKDAYKEFYARGDAGNQWHFLTGERANIRQLADTVGFPFRWNEKTQQWSHDSALMIITPDGRVSRYLFGLVYKTQDLRMALLEASSGKIGSLADQIVLWCHRYDDTTGQYTADVMKLVRVCGFITVAAIGITLFVLWKRDPMRRGQSREKNNSELSSMASARS